VNHSGRSTIRDSARMPVGERWHLKQKILSEPEVLAEKEIHMPREELIGAIRARLAEGDEPAPKNWSTQKWTDVILEFRAQQQDPTLLGENGKLKHTSWSEMRPMYSSFSPDFVYRPRQQRHLKQRGGGAPLSPTRSVAGTAGGGVPGVRTEQLRPRSAAAASAMAESALRRRRCVALMAEREQQQQAEREAAQRRARSSAMAAGSPMQQEAYTRLALGDARKALEQQQQQQQQQQSGPPRFNTKRVAGAVAGGGGGGSEGGSLGFGSGSGMPEVLGSTLESSRGGDPARSLHGARGTRSPSPAHLLSGSRLGQSKSGSIRSATSQRSSIKRLWINKGHMTGPKGIVHVRSGGFAEERLAWV
jgi:hypothetical protein